MMGYLLISLTAFQANILHLFLRLSALKVFSELLRPCEDRSAYFTSIITYCNGQKPHLFTGKTRGWIKEDETEGGWGFDPILFL